MLIQEDMMSIKIGNRQLLDIYALPNAIVYDPFMGAGTTAVACKQLNLNYIGSEISSEQCKYAKERIEKINISNDESDEQL